MIVRFIVKGLFSFGEQREFNLLPSSKSPGLAHHKKTVAGIDLLKLSALYGANGAGKSNLIKALHYLVILVREEKLPGRINRRKFKFYDDVKNENILLGIEFISNGIPFIYAIEFNEGIILTEELYKSEINQKEDVLLFERTTSVEGKVATKFSSEFEADTESKVLQKVIENNLAKPDEPIFQLLTTLDSPFLKDIGVAYQWFENTIQIVTPDSKPAALAHRVETEPMFSKYANSIMCAFHTGITKIKAEKELIQDFFGEAESEKLDELIAQIEDAPHKMISIGMGRREELVLVKEDDEVYVKRLNLEHQGGEDKQATFYLDEESDGTIRLLDYIPAFQDVTSKGKVFVIDEIERSIHPLLIKELIQKFSHDETSKGQLIFSTHESNLLDLDIFRQDEVWFVEKDRNGSTDLYPLSEFKEHHTKNIRRGYLDGRYGAIPFLGNLKDLSWNKYAITE